VSGSIHFKHVASILLPRLTATCFDIILDIYEPESDSTWYKNHEVFNNTTPLDKFTVSDLTRVVDDILGDPHFVSQMSKMMSKQVVFFLCRVCLSVCFWCSGNSSESLGLPLLEPVCGRLSAIFVVLVLICHNEYGYMYIQNDFDPQNVINRLLT
jgi:hypothetical protein